MVHLPLEIALNIIKAIPDFQDRIHLSQVCRSWRVCFLAAGFTTIEIPHPWLPCLVGVALANPEIRLKIRHISVKELFEEGEVRLWPAVRDLVDLLSDSPVAWEEWCTKLREPNPSAWIALLMASLPNLTSLSARHSYPWSWITLVVSKVAWKEPPFDGPLLALRHLESLDITWRDKKRYIPHTKYIPLFHLPSLRCLRVEGVREEMWEEWEAEDWVLRHLAFFPPVGTSPIESLVLDFFCIAENGMIDFISSCANLKRFIYQHSGNADGCRRDPEGCIIPGRFHRALLTQKHSLEVLHMSHLGRTMRSFYHRGGWRSEVVGNDRTFGSFADFHHLCDLRVNVNHLPVMRVSEGQPRDLLRHSLPRSLKQLYLTHCSGDSCDILIPHFQDLLDNKVECFPDLQCLVLAPSPEDACYGPTRIRDAFSRRLARLQRMCDGAAVELFIDEG